MTTLSKAPLIEVITQIRWGVATRNDSGELQRYVFADAEETELPDELARVLAQAGYVEVDPFAPEYEDVQFSVSRRYRKEPDTWPVYQSGLGVFTVNQGNEGYVWTTYKADVLRGIELLTEALQSIHPEPPFLGIELMYLDLFPLDGDQSPYDFLRTKFNIRPRPPREFFDVPFVEDEPLSASLSLELRTNNPEGVLTLSLDHEVNAGDSAYFMETRVLSFGSAVEFSREGLDNWLEAAHKVQQHAFSTLIKPAFRQSFL